MSGHLLEVRLNDELVVAVREADLPTPPLQPCVDTGGVDEVVVEFTWEGGRRRYDVSPVAARRRYAHFSFGVNGHRGVGGDMLFSSSADPEAAVHEFEAGAFAVRLQPFFLPGAPIDMLELRGRGPLARGMHQPGFVTAANVVGCWACDDCGASFCTLSMHCGFSDAAYLFCGSGRHTLAIDVGMLDDATVADWLRTLRVPCSACDSEFALANPLRCPHCNAVFIERPQYPADLGDEYYATWLLGAELQRAHVDAAATTQDVS